MKTTMIYDENSTFIPTFPLIKNKINLTSGTHYVDNMVHCVEYGSIKLLWPDGSSDTVDISENMEFGYRGDIEIVSGKFHIC